jgi:prepilin-type N-terminal cleavage/methylation domain-containing protein
MPGSKRSIGGAEGISPARLARLAGWEPGSAPTTPAGGPRCGEKGLTVIELDVVLVVMGVLLSIGLPTFGGLRERA